ncbi:MAG: TIGR03943 family protein [Chloroflexi bacterium]|nr:TIGR03943 family protein [Chloroflexota bacterium]
MALDTHLRRWSTMLLLFALAGLLFVRTVMDQMGWYIHPRYQVLLYICAGVLFVLAVMCAVGVVTLPRYATRLLLIPVLLGLAVPPRPLGADALVQQSPTLNRVAQRTREAPLPDVQTTHTWTLYDWAVVASIDPAMVIDKRADVEGFVVQNPALNVPDGQFMVARYVLNCCTADAGGVGMRVAWSNGKSLPNDKWVRVQGTVQTITIDGIEHPLLVADSVRAIEVPNRPYLTP